MTEHKMTSQLSEADILAYIRLSRTEKLGPVTFRRLMNLYGDPHAALSALPELAARKARNQDQTASADFFCQLAGNALACG